jgi:hypothetical protein
MGILFFFNLPILESVTLLRNGFTYYMLHYSFHIARYKHKRILNYSAEEEEESLTSEVKEEVLYLAEVNGDIVRILRT